MILDKKSIEEISGALKLPFKGDEQDWDLEMSDYKRLDDFISFYKSTNLNINQKKVLISLIVASFNDLLNEPSDDNYYWEKISSILSSEKEILKELCVYWESDKSLSNDSYKIAPFLRTVSE